MIHVFLDTDMLLDLFLERDNLVDNAEKILSKVYD